MSRGFAMEMEREIPFWVKKRISELQDFSTEKLQLCTDNTEFLNCHDLSLLTNTLIVALYPFSRHLREGLSLLP